ncbi:imidazole glycerol phosphate synthase subunit HisH [Spartinivicinus poritis]|uniref:Imidazole glycerol phosphate synthase subunit HisH n=1 Tax=Spartinivicinus poritis TaxID=2994640 RepID=A0ABT5U7W5_9GAMM|nr:imidazole glycerol phosphate synthase subunit HisH [Spartinivicinus sp. A2-2]MDE1462285.1 imidazole glycerol phosphate synthase subunit HisH [Spartinivicinus sp. A2-2]
MKPMIIDYGVGNLTSVKSAIERCGYEIFISNDVSDLLKASHVILPGVGAFSVAMISLKENGWVEALEDEVIKYQVPLLGICLGMQLLASTSEEGVLEDKIKGLDYIPGEVKKLKPKCNKERVPHVGWSEVQFASKSDIFSNIKNNTDFYFVHSYHFEPESEKHIVSTTEYCGGFCSAVSKDNVYGVQFHPEKSSKNGINILTNFLEIK